MSGNSFARRSRASAPRRLRLEQLEDRSLLAVAAVAVNLYEDAGGVPGALITDDAVGPGESFYLSLEIAEFHPLYTGLQRVALDISWDPSALEFADAELNPAEVITSALPIFLTGSLDRQAGAILDLGGSAFPAWNVGHAIGDQALEHFALLHFRALTGSAGSSIHLHQGDSRIATMPVSDLLNSEINFEQQFIGIAAAEEPVVIELDLPPLTESQPDSEFPPAMQPPGNPVNSEPPPAESPADEMAVTTAAPPPTIVWSCDPDAVWSAASEPIVTPPPAWPAAEAADPAGLELPALEPVEAWLEEAVPSVSADEELLDLIAAADPAAESAPAPAAADECSHDLRLADYISFTFVGPQTPEQHAPLIWRLEELIALLAAETDVRRTARSSHSTPFVCP